MIDFIKKKFGIFLIQKVLVQRNIQIYYETLYKISNEEFNEDLAREFEEIKRFTVFYRGQ